MKNISRMEYEHVQGWYVRVRRNRRNYQKHFSDLKYQGREKAFEAAVSFLETLLDRLNNKPKKKAKNGYIYRRIRIEKKYGKVYKWPTYFVWYQKESGKWTYKSWSIKKHGEQEAFIKAKQFTNQIKRR